MEGCGFSFNYARKLTIKCKKVNEPKESSNIKSPDWLKYNKCNNKSKRYWW